MKDCGKGEVGLKEREGEGCPIWEGSLSYLKEREGEGCLIWEGSLSYS